MKIKIIECERMTNAESKVNEWLEVSDVNVEQVQVTVCDVRETFFICILYSVKATKEAPKKKNGAKGS